MRAHDVVEARDGEVRVADKAGRIGKLKGFDQMQK
jgi:hypothetical protein